jgi:short-subunit dehydrogenase
VRIEGSTFLVTGASSGIGAALAPMLAARGAIVGLVARRADRLDAVLEQCRVHTPASRAFTADLADLDRAEAVAHEAAEALDGVDGLINNAGVPGRIPVPRLTGADVTRVMDVNFHAPVRMTLAFLPRWLERRSGVVVNVASLGGRIGIAQEASYCASKFALCGWSEVMAIDLHGSGVEVKLVLPGPIDTEIWDQPGNDAAAYDGPLVPAAECAASIVAAIVTPGFEFYAPPDLPGGMGSQHDIVVGKTTDPDGFLDLMGQLRPVREDERP